VENDSSSCKCSLWNIQIYEHLFFTCTHQMYYMAS
jgi:hypothetical protein